MKVSTMTNFWRMASGRKPIHPIYLIYFVTSRCMGHCKHCFYWNHLNQRESPLTVSEVDKIAESMGRIYQLTLTGGEPFLREDFSDLVERFYIHNNVYHLSIATSGYDPDAVEAVVAKLLRKCSGMKITIGLPIEGPAWLNNEIRGIPDAYERTAETLSRLKKIRQRAPQLTILIDMTISGFNSEWLLETYQHILEELAPDLINAILTRGNPRDGNALKINTDKIAELFSLMEQDIRKGRVRGYGFLPTLWHAKDMVLRRTALNIYKHGKFYSPCQAGRTIGVLMPEGDVYACELRETPIGNLRRFHYNFPSLWQSVSAARIRKEIIRTNCNCYHQCFLSNTLIWNRKAWPEIMREWIRIKKTKG